MTTTRLCSIVSCDRPLKARGYCAGHHQRWLTTGDPQADKPLRPMRRTPRSDVLGRFEFFVDRNGPIAPVMGTPCWTWTGQHNPGGYARFPIKRRQLMAHRWSYEHFVGPIPDGLTLDHLCRQPGCVNPDHLEPVTMAENTRRAPNQVTTINATKTHCIHGHEFAGWNLIISPTNGSRACRACIYRRIREYKARRKVAT